MPYNSEMGLEEWVEMFRNIYFPTQNYGRSRYQIFTRLVKNLAGGSHSILRRNDITAARVFLAKLFAWFCALVASVNEADLNGVVWAKYPGVCPRCLEAPCECGETPAGYDWNALEALDVENIRKRPNDLRSWQAMFARIYPTAAPETPTAASLHLALVLARVAEELGELGEALDLDDRIDSNAGRAVRNELADLFAWIMAIANSLQFMPDVGEGVWLADVAWSQYPARCPSCGQERCECVRGDYKLELASVGAAAPSQFDPRTGLANYRALEVALAPIGGTPSPGFVSRTASLIFFDLDRFGEVNKTFSHDIGDRVLRLRAEEAVRVVGEEGTVFRRGGEEFVVLLPGSDHDDAMQLAERLRTAFESELPYGPPDNRLVITASFGVSSWPTEATNGEELESLADQRARQAKANGRNRVVGGR